ncbi:hypothetical protein [Viridibacterium curvum]
MSARSRDYVEPSDGETARVRFSTNGDLTLIPERNCTDWSAPGAGVVTSSKNFIVGKPKYIDRKLGIPGTGPAGMASAEATVRAGKPLTVVFDSYEAIGDWRYTCKGSFAFIPKAGEDYQLTVRHDVGAGYCRYEPTMLSNPTQRVTIYKTEECKR